MNTKTGKIGIRLGALLLCLCLIGGAAANDDVCGGNESVYLRV